MVYDMLTLLQGEFLVKNARNAITEHLENGNVIELNKNKWLDEKRGIFVTLNSSKDNELRGCIGFSEPYYSLKEGLIKAAISVAKDPRFPQLKKEELNNILIEVSVLTIPKLMKVDDTKQYLTYIDVGKHGLVVELMGYTGLLLPQVPVEQGWDEKEFLEYACRKAGLPPESWINDATKIYTFESEVFSEEKPNGNVVKRKLK